MPNGKRRRLRSRDIERALGLEVFKVDSAGGEAAVTWLSRVRRGRRISLKALAALVGLPESNVCARLRERRSNKAPSLPTLTRFAKALGVAIILVPVDARGKTDPRLVIPPPKAKGPIEGA